jgi:chromosome segregation ATPase
VTPAARSLDHAQHALEQAAKTEKELRASLKKHSEEVSTARDDLDRRDRDLKTMKSQLKTAKKSRKRATKKLRHTPKSAATTG